MEFQDKNIKVNIPCFGWNCIFSQVALKTKTKCTSPGMIKILQHLEIKDFFDSRFLSGNYAL